MKKLQIKTYEMCGDYYDEMKEIYNQFVISKGGTFYEKDNVIDRLIRIGEIAKLAELPDIKFYTVCAFVGKKLAGYAILREKTVPSEKNVTNELYVSLIAVDKNFQGQGIGKALMNYAIHHSKGYERIASGAFIKNTASLKLHEKVGFSVLSSYKYSSLNGEHEGETYINFVHKLPKINSTLTVDEKEME